LQQSLEQTAATVSLHNNLTCHDIASNLNYNRISDNFMFLNSYQV
jgi:hypothetical protein